MRYQSTSTSDDLPQADLFAVDRPLPATSELEGRGGPAPRQSSMIEGAPASQTLAQLAEIRRPKAKTVCEACPNSVWFASPADLKCYCRVMFLVTWSSKEPQQLTSCDGLFLGPEK